MRALPTLTAVIGLGALALSLAPTAHADDDWRFGIGIPGAEMVAPPPAYAPPPPMYYGSPYDRPGYYPPMRYPPGYYGAPGYGYGGYGGYDGYGGYGGYDGYDGYGRYIGGYYPRGEWHYGGEEDDDDD